jgi:hypothetical protein
VYVAEDDQGLFKEAREKELRGLLGRGMFRVVKRAEVPHGIMIYGTRWVDTQKADGSKKSRLVAQNFRDHAASSVTTRSPTVSRLAQRVAVMSAAISRLPVFVRDVSQAYTQSESFLERSVYVRAPREMNLAEDEVLLLLRTLYGIPESGLHWFITFHNHYTEVLQMSSSRADPCLLYKHINTVPCGAILQVHDALGYGPDSFLEEEER